MAYYDRVPEIHKQQARDLLRLAKRRGVKLKLTKEQLNDFEIVRKFLAIYGNSPSDYLFARASLLAKYLKLKLSTEQALNKWHCEKFISEHRVKVPGGPPTEKQILLAEQLADYHGIDVPDKVRISLDEWNAFFERHLGREEYDILQDIENELATRVDFESYGSKVYHLNRSKRIFRDRYSLEEAKLGRARELLMVGDDPYSLATDLQVNLKSIFEIVRELEAEGHELIY